MDPRLRRFEKLPDWCKAAACAGHDTKIFFPEKGGSAEPAKALCARCPVISQCLDYALRNRERFGVWGGMSERERRNMRRFLPREVSPLRRHAGPPILPLRNSDGRFIASSARRRTR